MRWFRFISRTGATAPLRLRENAAPIKAPLPMSPFLIKARSFRSFREELKASKMSKESSKKVNKSKISERVLEGGKVERERVQN